MKDLDWKKLMDFVKHNENYVYRVYAGIYEDWKNTSDEIYFHEIGWIDNNDAHTLADDDQHPIVYIHGFDQLNSDPLDHWDPDPFDYFGVIQFEG